MDSLPLSHKRPIAFIIMVSKWMLVFVLAIFSSIFFVEVDDIVSFEKAHIYSKNPGTHITAPKASMVKKIYVSEGDTVKEGDTLIILSDLKIESEYHKSDTEIVATADKIKILKDIISGSFEEKKNYRKQITLCKNTFHNNLQKFKKEIKSLEYQQLLSEKSYKIAINQFDTDSLLYLKGVLSKIEFKNKKAIYLEHLKAREVQRHSLTQKKIALQNLRNQHQEHINVLDNNILRLDQKINSISLKIKEFKTDRTNAQHQLTYVDSEKERLIIRSPYDGTLPYLFNAEQRYQNIEQGKLLAIVTPKKDKFYAKVEVPESSLPLLYENQSVRLKFAAYNFYKYGSLEGVISYIAPSEIKHKFYCMVSFKEVPNTINLKTGLSIQGSIIVGSIPVQEFIKRSIFDKL